MKKNELKPWQKKEWCIPPEQDASFVCQMEEVLDIYTKPYDPQYPQVCMDEMSTELIGEVRAPLHAEPVSHFGTIPSIREMGRHTFLSLLHHELANVIPKQLSSGQKLIGRTLYANSLISI